MRAARLKSHHMKSLKKTASGDYVAKMPSLAVVRAKELAKEVIMAGAGAVAFMASIIFLFSH